MKTVAIIPARSGSVRIKNKNLKEFHGKPIIQYSIETAQRSRLFDEIWVSTDGEEIAKVAKSAGAKVFERGFDDGVRGTQEVAAEVLSDARLFKASIACVIYATAPMMTARDLIEGWQLLRHPGVTWARAGDVYGKDVGYFYWGHVEAFLARRPLSGQDTAVYTIPPYRAIDINTEDDFLRAERMYAGESI